MAWDAKEYWQRVYCVWHTTRMAKAEIQRSLHAGYIRSVADALLHTTTKWEVNMDDIKTMNLYLEEYPVSNGVITDEIATQLNTYNETGSFSS